MTKPIGRYHIEHNRAAPSPTGGWVLASDYDALAAELTDCQAGLAEMSATAAQYDDRVRDLEARLKEIARGKDSSDYGRDDAALRRLMATAAGAFELRG